MKNLYAHIEKTEQQDDGTIKVYGYASSPSEDSDGEIVTPAAIAASLPDYMKFGAVREMHQPKAAGTALEAKVMDDGRTWFGAHIVDMQAVKKVQAKVYKGFSIGGKVLDRDPANENVITGIKLVEISLVDRPANPDAVFTMYKADDLDKPKHDPAELAAIEHVVGMVNKGAILPSKLVELAQTFIKGDKTVNKSFWDVAELARLLGCLKSLQSSLAFNASYKGGTSDISNRLKQHINDLAAMLVEMIGEEVAESTSEGAESTSEGAESTSEGAMELSDTNTDVKKAGENAHGKDNGMHGDDEAAVKPKKKMADEDVEEVDATETADEDTQLDDSAGAKKADDGSDLAKADDMLAKFSSVLTKALDPIVKRLEHLEGQPAPTKGVLKTIGKAQDIGKGDHADEDTPPAGLTPEQLASWEIRKLHQTGGLIG
jgi:phage head maturation protease